MNEEEIIRNVKRIIEYKVISNYINNNDSNAIQGLLDLYNKEKEKNESLEQENSFLKQIYSGTEEFKAIEKLANKDY